MCLSSEHDFSYGYNSVIATYELYVVVSISCFFVNRLFLILYHENDGADSNDDQPNGAENMENENAEETLPAEPKTDLGANLILPRTEKTWGGLFNRSGSPDQTWTKACF